jgi:hypothetical protein
MKNVNTAIHARDAPPLNLPAQIHAAANKDEHITAAAAAMAAGDMGAALSTVWRREVMGSAERERRMNGRTELVGIAEGLGFVCSNAARHAQAVMELKGACIGPAEAAAAMLWCEVPLRKIIKQTKIQFL